MNKYAVLLLALAVAAMAGTCSASGGQEAKQVISAYLDASLHDRYEEAYSHISETARAEMSLEEYKARKESQIVIQCNEFTKRTTFKVESIEVKGDRATAEIEITEPDVRLILKDLVGAFVAWILDDEEEMEALEEEMEKKYSKGDIPMTSSIEVYHLVREQGAWKVDLQP
jgi:hypothetical protein